MPPIAVHMVLAQRIADALADEGIASAPGPYLLGATTPDIRVITRQDRFSTHFFDLDVMDDQDSVAGLFARYPALRDPGALSGETRAWVCGYVTHLVLDEQYITTVYRRHFLPHDRLGGTVRANVMDRLLQFDMERNCTDDPAVRDQLRVSLACTVDGIDAVFIDAATLDRWLGVTRDIAGQGMDWERSRRMISNHLRFTGVEEAEEVARLLDSLPELLDATIAHVTSIEIESFVDRATEAAAKAVERYLECG